MVYIKKLTIQGFKSFGPRRISIEFEKGFVVVTGPNGGGKSNVLDSIRFSLGELSAHNLRVGRMAELVHDDPSTTWARTSLTFDNSEKVLPIDSDEVTISRKITRTGESEYYVNGRQVSRNELLMLLSMANIKPSGFNIVPQGSVIEIAEMGGSELRKMLEEVAGISDYEKKKAEAEEQLAIAEKNLAIAKASAKEVKIRVKQLEKERNQAFRRRQVEEFLNAIKRLKLERGINTLESELREIDEQLLNLERKILELQNEKSQLLEEKNHVNMEIAKLSQKLEEIESELFGLQSERTELESRINELRINSSVLEERSTSILKEKEYFSDRIKNLSLSLQELDTKLVDSENALQTLTDRLEEKQKETKILLDELNEIEQKYQKLKDEVEEEEKARNEERLKWEIELSKARARSEEIKRTIAEISSEIAEAFKISKEKISNSFLLWSQLREKNEQKRELLEKLSEFRTSLNELTRKLSNMENASWRLSSILERIASSGVIKESDEYTEIIKAIHLAGLKGVRGFLRDAIIADETGYRILESAVGEWTKSLVVENWELGIKLAELFSECGIKVKIISLDVAASYPSKVKIPGITFKEKWAETVLGFLLRDVDLSGKDEALGEKKLVTRHLIIHPDLRIETIIPDRIILNEMLNSEYRNSTKLLKRLREIIVETRAEIEKIKEKMAEKERELNEVDSKIRSLSQRAWSLYFQSSEAILKEIKDILRLKRLEEELDKILETSKLAEKALEKIPEPQRGPREELSQLAERLKKKREIYEKSRLECVELEVEIKGLRKEIESLKGERERLLEETSRLERRMTQIEEEKEMALTKREELAREIKDLEERLLEKNSKIEELIASKSELKAKVNEFSEKMRKINSRIEQIEEDLQKSSSTKTSLQVRRAQLEIQLKNLREKMDSIGISEIRFPEIDETYLSKLEEKLEEELKELEMVNQLAPAQYEELIGNYKLRSSRIMELEAERMEIIKFIEWVEGEKKRIFMETFNKVADAFEEYFTRLTGGRGWLRLENPDNPFDGGVEMILAFPGKQPRSVRAASGGEKSVAAVALLLALQGLTPADFYVFDEVDAHMDLQYTKRLAELFKEMAKRTQIIVISLKDVMVEKADQVIGVYNSGGVSKIVKTKLEEVARSG